MSRRILPILLIVLLTLSGCACRHQWQGGSCTQSRICAHCGQEEGTAPGHTWQSATCTEPARCSSCGQTQGDPLPHRWQSATTEKPKTCADCGAVEGERIITDPRFTTAACARLMGVWSWEGTLQGSDLGLPDYTCPIPCRFTFYFTADGGAALVAEPQDMDAFTASMETYMQDMLRSQLTAQGIEDPDGAILEQTGMSVEEYVRHTVEASGMTDLISRFNFTGVYYVQGENLYLAPGWEGDFTGYPLAFQRDCPVLPGEAAGLPGQDLILANSTP